MQLYRISPDKDGNRRWHIEVTGIDIFLIVASVVVLLSYIF